MTVEAQGIDPYETVLADLRKKREQIDHAIQAIENLRGGAGVGSAPAAPQMSQPVAAEGPGAFLGMTIPDAAKALLATRRRPLNNPEISAAFKAGGLHMNSVDPVNTIGSVLTRRFNQVGDIVKVGRGTWGLAEWYPGRSFKKKAMSPVEAADVLEELERGGPEGDA
jgi:hypothetical protein